MKLLLTNYNKGLPPESEMSWEAASHLHQQTYRASIVPSAGDLIPLDVKYEAVQKWRVIERSREEVCLIKAEMRNCIDYYSKMISSLQRLLENLMYVYIIHYTRWQRCLRKNFVKCAVIFFQEQWFSLHNT